MEMESSGLCAKGWQPRLARSERRENACAILRPTGETKIHSIELALVRARGKYLIANALTYFQPATTMRDMLLICQETAQRVAVFGYSTATV